jgi:3-vinyl bacteriochlorophyllide hydratase
MFTSGVVGKVIDSIDACPWGSATGRHVHHGDARQTRRPLYTPEERVRRDATKWTLVQGVLAPVQFLVFLVSLTLVLRTLLTGEGYEAANASVVVKTFVLYTIMVTGAIWEKVVFGRYLFAPAFYWEDMFSMLVIALHTAYLATIVWHVGDARFQMWLALAAYAAYVVNAFQFVMKLRAARLDEQRKRDWSGHHDGMLGYSK